MRCVVLALIACSVFGAVASASEREAVRLPVVFHVARHAGEPVAGADFVREQLAITNRIFERYGVHFVHEERRKLAAKHARLETRRDRDALDRYFAHGAIHAFVVRSLRDVDDPSRMRNGVHWHSRRNDGAHYVIVTASAPPGVLAHELGHYTGNRRHSATVGNLMSYRWGKGLPVLNDEQVTKMRRTIRRYLRTGELQTAD